MKVRLRLFVYLIIFIGIALFLNSLTNSFIGDDFDQIVSNTSLLNPFNLQNFFTGSTFYGGGGESQSGLHYRPLMLFFYSIIYTLFGLKPIFFHIFQLILHISNTIMIFLFLRYFFKNSVSFLLSLVFLVHPINNETVVYIANLQDTLYLFFGLLATLLVQAGKIRGMLRGIFFLTLLLLLSIFSKETGILFIVILLLQSFLFKKIPPKIAIISSITSSSLYIFIRFIIADIYIPTQAIAPIANASFLERLLNLPAILFYYIKTLLYPVQLATTQFWIHRTIDISNFWLPLISTLLTLAAIVYLGIHLKKFPKSFNNYLFFVIWLTIGVGIHIHLIPLEMTVADRWMYFPLIGILGLLGLTIENTKILRLHKKILLTLAIIAICLLSYRSYIRNFDWKDPITLYENDTKVDNNNFFLENSLGSEYLIKGEHKKAKPHVEKSLALYQYFGNLNNMAVIASKEGDKKSTKKYLEKAIKIDNNYVVTENYAKFLYANEASQATINFINSALKRYPNNATLWMYYGLAENKLGNRKKALEYTQKAYQLNPSDLTKSTYEGLKGIKLK